MRRDVEREYRTPTRCRPVEQPWAYMLQRACVGDIRAARTAARRLATAPISNRAVSTEGLMAERGRLEVDPETDSSNTVFVTRGSVESSRVAHTTGSSKSRFDQATVPLADLIRFTGRD